jgi:hypothetical protein
LYSPGENAIVSIIGEPNTEYSITVTYPSGTVSTAQGLESKLSDANGNVSWIWMVGTRTRAGNGRIVVIGGGQTQTFDFTVL